MMLSEEHVRYAVLGGALLGGGGGGSIELGIALGTEAFKYGSVCLSSIEDLDLDGTFVSTSLVGAPGAQNINVPPSAYIESFDILQRNCDSDINGIVSNECGAVACVNGWLQSVVKKIPFVDAPANGRAHPTGTMGAMGLHKEVSYVSKQGFSGGTTSSKNYISGFYSGDITNTSLCVRYASTLAGGMVSVTRNPVKAKFIKEHAAVGAITNAITVGKAMVLAEPKGSEAMVKSALDVLDGDIICKDKISDMKIMTEGGFDIGEMTIGAYSLSFCNEYMTLENKDCVRLATFPDLIMTIDARTGIPVTTASAFSGQEVFLIKVAASKLTLGSGMYYPELYKPLEKSLGKELFAYFNDAKPLGG